MTNIIYGVDVDSDFKTIDVRDAIVLCFKQAHEDILKQAFNLETLNPKDVESFKNADIKMLVEKAFSTVGGDYNNPTKESLIGAINELKKFAINFRAEEIANKNFNEIMILINNLK